VKKILLLSDTHSYLDETILERASQHDEIWHAGDWGSIEVYDQLSEIKPVRGVYGNIDNHEIRTVCPHFQVFMCENVKVLMTHIGGYPGKYKTPVRNYILGEQPKLVICGHSHILKVIYDKNLNHLHMNPGAIGNHGFHHIRTMLSFKIDNSDIKDLVVLEYPK